MIDTSPALPIKVMYIKENFENTGRHKDKY